MITAHVPADGAELDRERIHQLHVPANQALRVVLLLAQHPFAVDSRVALGQSLHKFGGDLTAQQVAGSEKLEIPCDSRALVLAPLLGDPLPEDLLRDVLKDVMGASLLHHQAGRRVGAPLGERRGRGHSEPDHDIRVDLEVDEDRVYPLSCLGLPGAHTLHESGSADLFKGSL
jgi:hypothetical protein